VSVSELHNGLEMLLSFSKLKTDVANIICWAWRPGDEAKRFKPASHYMCK